MDDVLAKAGGTLSSADKKLYDSLTNKLYKALGGASGAMDDPKILSKLAKYTNRYPAFADDLVKMTNQLVPGIADDIAVRSGVAGVDDLAVRMMKLSDEIAELTRLENVVKELYTNKSDILSIKTDVTKETEVENLFSSVIILNINLYMIN